MACGVHRAHQGSGLAEFLGRHRRDRRWRRWDSNSSNHRTSADGRSGAAWFSTGTMLARTNFAATLAASQKDFLAATVAPLAHRRRLLDALLVRVTTTPLIQPRSRRSCRTSPPRVRGPAAVNNSTPGPRALLASSSALPSTTRVEAPIMDVSRRLFSVRRCHRLARDCRAVVPHRDRRRHKASAHATSSSSTLAAATTPSTRWSPISDAAYYSRRPSIAVPAGQVLQVGSALQDSHSVCIHGLADC